MRIRMSRRRPVKSCPTGRGKLILLLKAVVIILVLSSTLPTYQASAQSATPTYTFPECENVDENLLLSEINEITRSVFEEERSRLDIAAIVDRNWVKHGMDSVVDSAVDKAADQVLSEEGLWERIKSGWHPPTAEVFTTKVITSTFESPEFEVSIEELSQSIVDDLAVEMQVMTAISASSSLQCLQEFIGSTFSQTMAGYLETSVEKWVKKEVGDPHIDTEVGDILRERTPTLGGVSLVISTQIARLLAKNLTQQIVGKIIARIVGKVAGTWIPVVGWVIGGALIVWDLVLLEKGSVPQIREALKKEDVKQEVRTQIAAAVEEELDANLPALAESVTLDMLGQWERFLQSFELVLRLADRNTRFRAIVDSVTSDQVDKLSELVAVGTESLGTDWLDRIIENGKFERIFALSKDSFEILRETSDPDLVLNWADFSGDSIVKVVGTELYKVATPSDFADRETLSQVLALQDPSQIRQLMQFNSVSRSALLQPHTRQTKWLLAEIAEDDLVWIATYITSLPGPAIERLVDFAIRDQELIPVLMGSQELQSKFPEVLALAESSPTIQTVLESTTADQVHKLADLVAISNEVLEPEDLPAMIEQGQFEAILALPRAALVILEESKDASTVIAWAELAGEELVQVVETRLFSLAAPSSFSGDYGLSRVLALEEHEAIRKLMTLDEAGRDVLVELPTVQAKAVLGVLSEDDLSWLAQYLRDLPEDNRGLVTAYILQVYGVLKELKFSEDLRSHLPLALTLAESDPLFLAILNTTSVDSVEKLSKLVAVASSAMTPDQLATMIETGQFEQIFSLPEVAFEILEERKDPRLVLAWAELAGAEIERVVKTELYIVAPPSEFSGRDALNKVLALEDPSAIEKLMQMHQIERVVLLGLETDGARSAITDLSMEDLSWLALYLADLAADVKDPVVEFILRDHGLIPWLKESENLRTKLPRVLMLALDIQRFEEILARASVDEVEKLAELVTAADATMGPEQIAQMIETGQFEAILLLPQVSFDILRVTGNPDLVLEWADLADEALTLVVETGLYLVSSPAAFSGLKELERVLAIEDPLAIQRLMNLDKEARDLLLELPPKEAKATLLADLKQDELSWLAAFMRDLPEASRQLFAYFVVREPGLISKLMDSKELSARFPRTIGLAFDLPHFRQILESTNVQVIGKVSRLADLAETTLGLEKLAEIIESGEFERLLSLPQPAFEILEWSKSPDTVFEWSELAGDAIEGVVEKGLYKIARPDHFEDRQELDKALSIENADVLEWILQAKPVDRSFFLTELESSQLVWLYEFKSGWSDDKTILLARRMNENLVLESELAIEEVGLSIKKSPIFESEVAFVSKRAGEPRTRLPTMPMFLAASSAIGGDLSWSLYQYYYMVPSLILLFGLVVVIVLSIGGWWLLRRRRPEENASDNSDTT